MLLRILLDGRDPPVDIDMSGTIESQTLGSLLQRIVSHANQSSSSAARARTRQHVRLVMEGKLVFDGFGFFRTGKIVPEIPLAELSVRGGSVLYCSILEQTSLRNRPLGTASESNIPKRSSMDACRHMGYGAIGNPDAVNASSLSESSSASAALSYGSENESCERITLYDDSESFDRAPPVEFGQDPGLSIEEQDEINGGLSDFCNGLLLGGSFGIILLLLTYDKTISFSNNFQSGVRVGVILNFLLGVMIFLDEGNAAAIAQF